MSSSIITDTSLDSQVLFLKINILPCKTTNLTDAKPLTGKPSTYSQYLHGVYVAGALAQLFATQVRDRSVRSLFKQLRLATVQDIERIGMDVDTWEDAAVMERRLAGLA